MSERSWTMRRAIVAAWLALAVTGCATTPAPRSPDTRSPVPGRTSGGAPEPRSTDEPAPVSPMPGTPVGTTASGGQITSGAAQPSLLDTMPSAAAREVLGSIPEPLPLGERVPPPGGSSAASADTSEDDGGDVPVPAPTRPLGDRPAPPTIPDTSAAQPPGGSVTPPSYSPPPAPPRAEATSDTCWRVQVAAPPEPERAQALREAAQSQLGGVWVIETEGRLHKVRTRDCFGTEAAERLRRRAENVGFAGAFRLRRK